MNRNCVCKEKHIPRLGGRFCWNTFNHFRRRLLVTGTLKVAIAGTVGAVCRLFQGAV
jgi:hypothetical protein